MVKCYLCGGPHLAKDHLCPVDGCGKRTPCRHLPTKCANCLGKHYATSVQCPKKWEAIRLAKEKAKNPRPATPGSVQNTQEVPRTPRNTNPPHVDIDMDDLYISSTSLPVTPTPAGPRGLEN